MITGEQTNIPKNEEEHAAAMAKKEAADAEEQKAHEAARAGGKVPVDVRVTAAAHTALNALWEFAESTGNLTAYVNAVLFQAAVILANTKTHAEYVRAIEYMSKTASDLRAKSHEKEKGDGGN